MTFLGQAQLVAPIDRKDHVRGSRNASLTVVEYGDFECPACRAAEPVVQQLGEMLTDRWLFAFRSFPLTTVHPHAERAAEAAEVAASQGRYWEMHDLLFENQDALNDEDLVAYASMLGLDQRQFAAELMQHVYAPRVREVFLGGVRSGVNGTPTFFIGGWRYDGPVTINGMIAAIENSLD